MTIEWRKSSKSGGGGSGGSDCVELADLGPTVGVRDSKDPEGPKLTLTGEGFVTLVARIKDHKHDLA